MEKPLVVLILITAVFSILIPGFIWINNNFNEYPEEFDDLEDGALMKLEIKKQLLNELHQWINENNLTNDQIGEKLAVNKKTIANIVYQRVDKLTIDALVNLLLRAGKKVTVSIGEQHAT